MDHDLEMRIRNFRDREFSAIPQDILRRAYTRHSLRNVSSNRWECDRCGKVSSGGAWCPHCGGTLSVYKPNTNSPDQWLCCINIHWIVMNDHVEQFITTNLLTVAQCGFHVYQTATYLSENYIVLGLDGQSWDESWAQLHKAYREYLIGVENSEPIRPGDVCDDCEFGSVDNPPLLGKCVSCDRLLTK